MIFLFGKSSRVEGDDSTRRFRKKREQLLTAMSFSGCRGDVVDDGTFESVASEEVLRSRAAGHHRNLGQSSSVDARSGAPGIDSVTGDHANGRRERPQDERHTKSVSVDHPGVYFSNETTGGPQKFPRVSPRPGGKSIQSHALEGGKVTRAHGNGYGRALLVERAREKAYLRLHAATSCVAREQQNEALVSIHLVIVARPSALLSPPPNLDEREHL